MTALRLVTAADEPGDNDPGTDLLTGWVEFLTATGCSPATVNLQYRSMRALMGHAGVSDPLNLTRHHVISWLARPVKPWSRLTYYKAVRAWSMWMRDFGGDPDYDLVKGIPRPKTPDAVPRPIDDGVIERLLAAQLSDRAHAYVRLALYQALRVHEIAKIQAEDFDFEAGWLSVTGKGGITRPIPIHPQIARLADSMPEAGYWFPSHTGTGHVAAEGVSATIKSALKAAGSTATAHQLRDTAATRMQRTYKDIRVTQSMLRHRNIQSTMKYTAASNADLQEALGGLDWTDAAGTPPPAMSTLVDSDVKALLAQLVKALRGAESG
ncbi:MAG TPA: site-specific integrase [Propionibacteriaceae bacterium]|nr:site-specific integrase [Propionibacteriaceae bacterium]